VERWKSRQKRIAMGAEGPAETRKQRDFEAKMVFSKTGVWHQWSKNANSHEKTQPAINPVRHGFCAVDLMRELVVFSPFPLALGLHFAHLWRHGQTPQEPAS
jgi:hypothetical protein